jgi:IPT/TIG domain/Carboxypeptidase regulatory-like domain
MGVIGRLGRRVRGGQSASGVVTLTYRLTALSIGVVLGIVGGLVVSPLRAEAVVGVAGAFVAVSPARILDTRSTGGKLAAGESRPIPVTGLGGVPSSGVSAVVLNVTVTETTAGGYLTVSPTGSARPTASNLNWSGAGVTIPNAVVVKLGSGGKVDVFQSGPGTAQVIVDVAGYYLGGSVTEAGGFTALSPQRILDTRATGGAISAGSARSLRVTGQGGVPASNVSAVVLNVTVTETTAGGYLTVSPTGVARPTASNLNWSRSGVTIPNLVVVKVGDGGAVDLFQSGPGTAQVIVDVAGYFLAGDVSVAGMFVAVSPSRILDTRNTAAVAAGQDVTVLVTGKGGVPASGVSAVVMNTTVTETGAGGFLTVYPGTSALPTASNLNWSEAGVTIPNLVTVQLGSDGSVKIRNGSPRSVQVIADIAGYYLAAAPVPAPTIATVSPASGSVTGGVVVTITGTNLTGVTAVSFDGVAGTALTPVSATQLTVATPAHAAGAVDVAVTTPGGTATSVGAFTYQPVVPPGPVTGVSAVPASTSIVLSWTDPTAASFTGVMIRRALGATPPATATAGTLVVDAAKPATSYTNTGLASLTQYSYALFAHDGTPVYAAAATVTSTTTAAGSGAVSGTVTDAGGAHHGLANVSVKAYTASIGGSGTTVTAVTAANGSYTVTGLPAATDYEVCFTATGATGGSSDPTGYIAQCYNNQPTSSTATPVTVTLGATTTGINAALAGGGAVSGTVTDAGGAHHGLANVTAVVTTSTFVRAVGSATTAANGSYTVTGLPSATDYKVCFDGSAATGGSSDPTGYVDQCYTPTPVTVTVGATTTGINAALAGGGAMSGTVTDAGGTHHGLAPVRVTARIAGANEYAWTGADGTWSMTGLSAGTYYVCFEASWWATGGSSDVIGYADQCYNNTPPVWGSTTPVPVTVGETAIGINAALVAAGAMSGTVTDAGGTHHGLAGVSVHMFSPTTADTGDATTAADGSYTVTHLTAGSYKVCFWASGATGGSSDALGYVDQCYNNKPTSSTATPVTVTLGATTPGINAALAGGGAVSGTVTDAGGAHHGLANVSVNVWSPSTGGGGYATTAANGSYTVTGLPSATDYTVRFYGSGATGGASDATGYFDQYYDNQTSDDAATPVTATAGATITGINAALIGKP